MKRTVLAAFFVASFLHTHAQVTTDTVSIGAAYANQVWYSLASDNQGSAPKNYWDIAFDASGFGSAIMINSVIGTTLWKYPLAGTSGWSTVDTTGLSTWPACWNSDTSWARGAMGNYADPANPSDLDWGVYNVTTHIVTGDSLYIIKLASGEYKKLWIESLASSVYTFKFANIDGSDEHEATLDKTAYSTKNFGYYSLQTNTALDREPASGNWDLLFTQYTAFIPTAYTVTGILANAEVQIAKATEVADVATYTDWSSATFATPINGIGYNWKTFTGTAYEVQDSTVYFVKAVSGSIWKVVMAGFGGSATGNFMFTKEKLQTETSGISATNSSSAAMALYPNPSNGQNAGLLYSLNANTTAAVLTITDISGRTVFTSQLDASLGLHQYHIPAALQQGIYIVTIHTGNINLQQKLIIQ